MEERLREYDNNGIGLLEGFAYLPGLLRGGQIEAILGYGSYLITDAAATGIVTSTAGSQFFGALTGSDGGGNFGLRSWLGIWLELQHLYLSLLV